MFTAPGTDFCYEIEEEQDENDIKVTVVKCHGRITSENKDEIRSVVQPLILRGGRIALDFADVDYLDSAGLGAIVGLKVAAIREFLLRYSRIADRPFRFTEPVASTELAYRLTSRDPHCCWVP